MCTQLQSSADIFPPIENSVVFGLFDGLYIAASVGVRSCDLYYFIPEVLLRVTVALAEQEYKRSIRWCIVRLLQTTVEGRFNATVAVTDMEADYSLVKSTYKLQTLSR